MLRVVIVDDEPLAIEELKYLLSLNPEIQVVKTFTSPIEAESYIVSSKPDVVFLDIQMPIKTGLDIAKHITNLNIKINIIFVTAFETFAIDAFEFSAFDYILKPINSKRLESTLQKLIDNAAARRTLKLNTNTLTSSNKSFITLYNNGVYVPVKFNEIIYCQSDDGIITINTEKNRFKYNGNFSDLEELLKFSHFFRCHRSYIINIEKIEKIEPTERTYLLKMKHKPDLIPVSRSNSNHFKMIMSIC